MITPVEMLCSGEIEILGLLPYASNATLLVKLIHGDAEALAVYKPQRGERPLWDFPSGTLCNREVAAFVVSDALGWDLVPPTVLREGPAGIGSLQWFIDEDPEADVRTALSTHADELMRIVLFDVIANNADRKGGHVLLDKTGGIWAIDHGVCFAAEHKLRTILWVHEEAPIPDALLDDVARFAQSDKQEIRGLLDGDELDALDERVAELLETKTFPAQDPYGRNVPWPPW